MSHIEETALLNAIVAAVAVRGEGVSNDSETIGMSPTEILITLKVVEIDEIVVIEIGTEITDKLIVLRDELQRPLTPGILVMNLTEGGVMEVAEITKVVVTEEEVTAGVERMVVILVGRGARGTGAEIEHTGETESGEEGETIAEVRRGFIKTIIENRLNPPS